MKKNKIINFDNNKLNNSEFIRLSKNKSKFKKDKTDYSQIIVRKPWGYEYLIFENKDVAVWILHIKSKYQTSMHCHTQKKTSLIVLKGSVLSKNLDNKYLRDKGQAVLIDKQVFHSTFNHTGKSAIIMEIESPNNKHDLLRLKDPYGRVLKGYEKKGSFSVNTNNFNYISLKSENTYHNSTKKIENTSITFIKILNYLEFAEFVKLNHNENALVSILSGEIFIGKKKYTHADTLELSFVFNKLDQVILRKSIVVLLTNENDNKIKCSDLIFNILENENINKAFVVAGDSNLHLLDSLGKKEAFEHIVFNNEFFASFAALGQSKLSHKPSLLIISSGSSALKVIEAVCNAYIDSEPMIIISGQASSDYKASSKIRQLGSKTIDIIKLVKSITKYSVTIKNPNELTYHIEKAIYLSKEGRAGPVWIDVPIDLLGNTINEKRIKHFDYSLLENGNDYKESNIFISKIYKLIANSKRPVILIGYGVRLSNSQKQILELIEMLEIPVMTSRRGVDLINSKNKYFFGRPGVYGNRYSNILIQKADLLISIGSRLSIPMIGRKKLDFAKNAKKIVIDIDHNELLKTTIKKDLIIKSSCDVIINLLLKNNKKIKKFDSWLKKCVQIKNKISFKFENYCHSDKINPYIFVKDLSKKIPSKTIMFMDGGPIMNYLMQGIEIKKDQRLINASGLDNDGFALSAVMGIDSIKPYNFLIVFCEESSLVFHLEYINMLIKKNIPIKIFAFSGAKNIALKNSQKDYFDSRYVATNDYDKPHSLFHTISEKNSNIKIVKISNPNNYNKNIAQIFRNYKTEIFLIKLDPEHRLTPKLGFSIDFNGKWLPKSLEDMHPFMEKQKLKKIMDE